MAIQLTENAARHVAEQLKRRGRGLGLRLGTRKAGCNGFAYEVEYADEVGAEDLVFETHGVRVVLNNAELPRLDGMEVDYVRTNALNEGFEFHNPNVRTQCGCGESFGV